jgi:Phage tail sheath protein subtilisin-like domain/Phage tail sheath C-terminal domain
MSFLNQLSPGVIVNEVDLTTIVPGVSTSRGAFVGQFNWGPVLEPRLINDETGLLNTFQRPTDSSLNSFVGTSFFSCANFLSYSNSLFVVRVVGANARNSLSSSNANASITVSNELVFENSYLYANTNNAYGPFISRFPGVLGDSIAVGVCSNTSSFTGWDYDEYFDNAPGTSEFVSNKNSANDEMHIVVVDRLGRFTGVAGTVIEKFPFVSKASDAVGVDGQSSYYKNVIFNNSQYIFAVDPVDFANTSVTWGTASYTSNNFASVTNQYITLSGGADGDAISANNITNGWDIFKNRDTYDVSFLITGSASDVSLTIPRYIIDNIIDGSSASTPIQGRRDSVVFISPRYQDVVNQAGQEATNITNNFLATLDKSSSYAVVDSGWKYQYDKYNNIYRWVPLNADIAGTCAATDLAQDPWWSPAGFSRGKIKNVTKLAWNPNQAERDFIYPRGVNPVVSFQGEGVVLFGDKTLQSKPSAFDRINVRRLFIVLEKAISRAAQYSLFEFNDQFTRAQFVAIVEPYLRTIQGRRGIYDFKVVCDETNNTPDIIDRNGFVGDIYVKPARSINFIQLNFIAVRTGVEFNTVVGQF